MPTTTVPRTGSSPVLPTLERMRGRPGRSAAARRRLRGGLVALAGAVGYLAMIRYLLGLH